MEILSNLKDQIREKNIEALHIEANRVINEIDSIFHDFKNMVQSKRDIKVTEIEDFESLEKQQIEATIRNIDQVYKTYTRVYSETENLLAEKHDVTFYLCYKTLYNDIKNLDALPDEPDKATVPSFDVKCFFKEIVDYVNSKLGER